MSYHDPTKAPERSNNEIGSSSDIPSYPYNFASGYATTSQQFSNQHYDPSQYQQYYQQYYASAQYPQQGTYMAGSSQASGTYLNPQQYAVYYQQGVPTVGETINKEHQNGEDHEDDDDDDDPTIAKQSTTKASNALPIHCNEKNMGLNPLIYSNIQQSPYFKTTLFQLKTYHEVLDEIYYNVKHLEPWEKGSRRVGGQTGLCGSVRGVGAGGIISTPFCLLFKLFTLRLTRKQLNGLIRHKDSPYIRALGFMYIRYTQPPKNLWTWFEPFLEDDEQVDPKAGGGEPILIGEMLRHFLTKLEWYSTLFPRIPIPIQKEIEEKLNEYDSKNDNFKSKNEKDRRKETTKRDYETTRSNHNQKNNKYSDREESSKRPRSSSRERSPFQTDRSRNKSSSHSWQRDRKSDTNYHKTQRY